MRKSQCVSMVIMEGTRHPPQTEYFYLKNYIIWQAKLYIYIQIENTLYRRSTPRNKQTLLKIGFDILHLQIDRL